MDPANRMQIVEKLYQAFGEANVALLAGNVTDNFQIRIPQMDHLPLESSYEGVAGFQQLLDDRKGRVEYDTFQTTDTIVHGDVVVVVGYTEGRAVVEGASFKHGWVHVFRFTGDRISSFKEYIDSSSVCSAFCP